MRWLSKCHAARVDRQSQCVFGLTRSPELVCRSGQVSERPLLFEFHTPKIVPETFPRLWGVHPIRWPGPTRGGWRRRGRPSPYRGQNGDAVGDSLHWRPSWQVTGRRVTRGCRERGARSTQYDNEKRSDAFLFKLTTNELTPFPFNF